jgi:hypothetical protein
LDDKRVVRFEIEYDDGTIGYLEADDADRHFKWLNGCCMIDHIHGGTGPGDPPLNWKERKK